MAKAVRQAVNLVQNLLSGGGTLSQRAARGGVWAFVEYGGVRSLTFVRSVILARLLMPADFGLVGMAGVATGFLVIWTELGMAPALIYKQDADDDVLHTAWIISGARGIVLALFTFLSAGLFAWFFKSSALVPILRVMALVFAIHGLNSIGMVLLKKELDFRRLAWFDLTTEALSLAVGVVAALLLRNAWALVLASLAKNVFEMIGSYLIHPYRPQLRLTSRAAKGLLSYGRYIFGGGVVNYFLTNGDNALVGRMLGATQLGLYGMGYNLANMPSTTMSSVIGQVAFPTYAKLQNDPPALLRAYLRVLKLIAILVIPAIGGIVALAPELIRVVYGQKWMPVVVPLMIMCVAGLERALTSPVAPVFNAMGKPRTVFYLVLLKLVLFASIIYPLTARFGIVGTSAAGALVSVAVFSYSLPLIGRLLGCRATLLLRPLIGPFVGTIVMMGSLYLTKTLGRFQPNLFTLILLIGQGIVLYAVSLYLVDRPAIREVAHLIASQARPPEVAVPRTSKVGSGVR